MDGQSDIRVCGARGIEVRYARPGRVLRSRIVAAGSRVYSVSASAAEWGDDQQRFLGSLQLTDTATAPLAPAERGPPE